MNEYKDKTCTYLMGLPNNTRHEIIDPNKNGNMARFINRSCDPNCETRKRRIKGELCIGIFAKKGIKEDEELTSIYDFDLNKTRYQKCLCGAKNCVGYLWISTEENKKNNFCNLCKESFRHSESFIEYMVCENFSFLSNIESIANSGDNGNTGTGGYKCSHCLNNNLNSPEDIPKKKQKVIVKEKIKLDEDPIYDEIYEVGDRGLQKIKKNFRELIKIGAMLFWDFQCENVILGTNNKFKLKISWNNKAN